MSRFRRRAARDMPSATFARIVSGQIHFHQISIYGTDGDWGNNHVIGVTGQRTIGAT